MNKSFYTLIIWLVAEFAGLSATAQTKSERLRIDHALDLAANTTEGQTVYNKTLFDNITDTIDQKGYLLARSSASRLKPTLRANLTFRNCNFERIGTITGFVFNRHVWFENCKLPKGLKFVNCRFKNGLEFSYCHAGDLEFTNCSFERGTDSSGTSVSLYALSSEYYSYLEQGPDSIASKRVFEGCKFGNGMWCSGSGGAEGVKSYLFDMCVFGPGKAAAILKYKTCSRVDVLGCKFYNKATFAGLNVSGGFRIVESSFKKSVAIRAVSYDESMTNVDYDSIRHRLTSDNYDTLVYFPTTDRALADEDNFKSLMNTMYHLHSLYKSRGDIRSANKVYTDLRDYETNMLKYLYEKDHSIDSYFDWTMNLFLRKFCAYGTKPFISIKYAMAAVLIFALLYFLFPSEPDNLSRERLLPAFEKLLSKTGALPSENPQAPFQEETARLEKLLKVTNTHRSNIPKPFFGFGLLLIKATLGYYRYLNRLRMPYPSVPRSKKMAPALMAFNFGYLLVFLFSGLFMRMLNAIALSVNAFVTLGYGELQAKGVARYLVVLEGAIGWFLLGIFSVSLISQILG